MKAYFYKVFIAISMLVNVISGGEVGQTLSARHHQLHREGNFNISWLIDFFCGKKHCSLCWSYWKVRKW